MKGVELSRGSCGHQGLRPTEELQGIVCWWWYFSCSVMFDCCDPVDCVACQVPVDGILEARTLEWSPFPSPGDLPDLGIEPRSPGLQADSLPTELQWKPSSLLLLSHFSCVRLCVTPEWQPTRLPHPWDSPGKNIGVGCHFLLQCMKVKSESEAAQLCLTLRDPMDCSPTGSSLHGIIPGKSTGVGCHCLLWPSRLEYTKDHPISPISSHLIPSPPPICHWLRAMTSMMGEAGGGQ